MFRFLPIAALLVAATVNGASVHPWRFANPNGRIVGGENAVIETYPYQVSITMSGLLDCGGSIIAPNYVLTAAHCVEYLRPHMLKVRAGSSFLSKGGSEHNVSKIIMYEGYGVTEHGVPYNDIALIRVAEPFVFDETRQPISLYEIGEFTAPGLQGVLTGWGDLGNDTLPDQLQTVTVPIISKELCNKAYEKLGGLPKGQICGGYYGVGGKDTCQGDSGGPLAINGRLAGVVSWGYGCAEPDYPGAYTEVAYWREWINKNMALEKCFNQE